MERRNINELRSAIPFPPLIQYWPLWDRRPFVVVLALASGCQVFVKLHWASLVGCLLAQDSVSREERLDVALNSLLLCCFSVVAAAVLRILRVCVIIWVFVCVFLLGFVCVLWCYHWLLPVLLLLLLLQLLLWQVQASAPGWRWPLCQPTRRLPVWIPDSNWDRTYLFLKSDGFTCSANVIYFSFST